jgi:phosphatidylglycerophosphate synthase
MEKTAVILASDEKGLQLVYGIPVIRRLVLLLRRAGICSVHVAGRLKPYLSVLSDLVPAQALHEIDNPESLGSIMEGLAFRDEERILALRANLVIDSPSLGSILQDEKNRDILFWAGNGKAGPDLAFLVNRSHIPPILRSLWSSEPLDSKIKEEAARLEGVGGLPHAVGEGEESGAAEDHLLKALANQTKSSDGFLARKVSRRISPFFSKKLAHTRMTPNEITIIGASIGLLGAFFLAQPGYWARLFGAFLFVVCVIVDGVDGEVARLKLQETPFGHYLDIILDNVVHVVLFAAIAIGLYRGTGDAGYVKALLFLLAGFGLCGVSVYYFILRPATDEFRRSPATLRLMALVTNRDFAYLVLALALVDRLGWFLKGAALGTFLFAAALWAVSLFGARSEKDQTP